MHILIRNGTIVNAESTISQDILVKDSQILFTGVGIQKEVLVNKIIDASGCFIFPGGIDPHVHLHLPNQTGFSSDDFLTGSKAALHGGTTSFIDFVTPQRGQSIFEALMERKEEALKSLADYKFHVSPVEWVAGTEQEIYRCFKEQGIRSVKVYMAYKNSIGINDAAIFQVMKAVAKLGGIVTVHCEMGDEIEIFQNKFISEGKSSVKYHALSRPAELEAVAVKRAIDLAATAGCPLYIVHVSTKEALDHIRTAQESLQTVYAETCPQYLFFDDRLYDKDFEKSAPYVFSPPLRKESDIEALWQAIADGTIQTIGTDHCPFLMKQKKAGVKDFRKIPNGTGGIEHRLALLYTYGVLKKRISINHFVGLISTQVAKIFDLYPRKGAILKGSDADIVIWDPKPKHKISVKNHHQNCDLNIYEGFETFGHARYVISKGKIVIENGEIVNKYKGLYLI